MQKNQSAKFTSIYSQKIMYKSAYKPLSNNNTQYDTQIIGVNSTQSFYLVLNLRFTITPRHDKDLPLTARRCISLQFTQKTLSINYKTCMFTLADYPLLIPRLNSESEFSAIHRSKFCRGRNGCTDRRSLYV